MILRWKHVRSSITLSSLVNNIYRHIPSIQIHLPVEKKSVDISSTVIKLTPCLKLGCKIVGVHHAAIVSNVTFLSRTFLTGRSKSLDYSPDSRFKVVEAYV